MSKIWVISDTHFQHEKIIEYCNRPFKSTKDMDDTILSNWNALVSNDDIIYHLGDVYFGAIPSYLYNLKGRKRLILGNHDNAKDQALQKVFEKIMLWRKWPQFKCILSHIPLHKTALKGNNEKYDFGDYINIHGHIHANKSPEGKYINACVEWTDYKPIELEDLLDRW